MQRHRISVSVVLCCGWTHSTSWSHFMLRNPCHNNHNWTRGPFPQCPWSKSTMVKRHANLYWVHSPCPLFFQGRSVRLNQACWAPPLTPTSTSTAPSTRSPSLHSTSLMRIMRKSVPPHHHQRRPLLLRRSKTARTMSLTRSHRYDQLLNTLHFHFIV